MSIKKLMRIALVIYAVLLMIFAEKVPFMGRTVAKYGLTVVGLKMFADAYE